jgi:membrane protein
MPVRDDGAVEQPPAGGPESPLDVPPSGWRHTLRRTIREIKQDRITITAAGVAFYWFLSVFPLLFVAIAAIAITDASPSLVRGINNAITTALPGDASTILTDAVSDAQGRTSGGVTALLVGIAVALWSASSGMSATQVGLDVAYDVPEGRPFVKKRLVGLALIIVALLLGGAAVALLVFGEPLGEFVRDQVLAGDYFVWLWTAARWALTLLAIVTLFAVFYYIGPNRQPPSWKWLSPGGLVGTAIWVVASVGFSLYVSNFGGSYAETYGALAGVVILLLWMYLSALAVLFGAELNGELERERALRAEEEERVSSEAPPGSPRRRATTPEPL